MDEQLLIRFLTHTSTPEDTLLIDQWITSDKANADWLFEMERIWSLKDELRFSDKKEIEEAYNHFARSQGKNTKTIRRFYLPPLLKYVAAVLIIGLLGLNLYKMTEAKPSGENVIVVPKGQRASLTLSDGSKVWLNSQSKLTYPTHFSDKERTIRLEGEAFFEVEHNKHIPFIVNTPLLAVKVLGTQFNVKAYLSEKAIVTLTEGKVEVETNDHENKLTLKPNEQVSYSKSSGIILEKDIDAYKVQSWREGEITFVQQKLDDIVRHLERKFNVEISITDQSLRAEIFTCRFKNTATIEQVLFMLKETRRLDYSFEGERIRIFKPQK